MSDWPEVELGDHVDILAGFAFKSAQFSDDPDGGIRLLRGDNVAQGDLRWSGAKHWAASEYADFERYHLAEGDVILAMDRPWIEAGLKYAYVRKSDLPCLLVQRVSRMRGLSTLDTAFLRYLIGSQAFTGHVQGIITGVNVPHISSRDIKRFRFMLPPFDTQRRIALILGAYDDLIEVNRRRVAVLEEMARGLFEEWFVRLRFPGHESAPLIETPGGPLPQGWKWGKAKEVIAFDPKTKVPKDGDKPFIPMGYLDTVTSLIAPPESRAGNSGAKFRNGDTLFARITPCLENGKTGLVRDLPGVNGIGFGSTEFIVMRGEVSGPAFTYCLSRLPAFRDHARSSMSGATGRQRARTESVENYEMAVPASNDLLDRFESAAWPMLELVGKLGSMNERLAASRDLMLPRLISGQLSVEAAERELELAA